MLRTRYKTSVPISTSVGTQVASSGTAGSLCCSESKAKDFEKLTNLVLMSIAVLGRDPAGNRCKVSCKPVWRCVLASSLQRTFNAAWLVAAELETDWNLDTESRRHKRSSELRTARPKILITNPPCPLLLKLQNSNIGKSNLVESWRYSVTQTMLETWERKKSRCGMAVMW